MCVTSFLLAFSFAAIPRPWTPVTAGDGKVSVWGRDYAFASNALPVSVTSLGRELLAGPVRVICADNGGKPDEAAAFRKRAKNYRNLWNAAEGKFWPRKSNGNWVEKPRVHWNHTDYTEQSPETAVWGVPYDVEGVAGAIEGLTLVIRSE